MVCTFVIVLIISVGLLKKWQLIFYGTSEPPVRLIPKKKFYNQIQTKTKLKHNEKEVYYSWLAGPLALGLLPPL